MSWLDFFRNKKEKGRKSNEVDRITIEDLHSKLKTEFKHIEDNFQEIRNRLRERILQLNSDLEIMVNELKKVNLEERREEERLKFIVTQNVDTYISNLVSLTDNLKVLDKNDTDYLRKVQTVFSNFIKSSASTLEKARILIGKELGDIKNTINLFADDVASMMNETNRIFVRQKALNKLEVLFSALEEEKNAEHSVEDSLSKLEQSLKAIEERRILQIKNLDDARSSNEYKTALEEKEKVKHKLRELQQEIVRLEHDIDLKYLSKHFHNDEKKNKIIRDYSENFEESLENDSNLKIGEIIREVKPNFDIQRLTEAKLKNRELKNWQQTPIEKQIENTEAEIKRGDLEMLDIKKDIEQERKKKERLIERTSQILEEIKKEAMLLWNNLEIAY